MATTDVKTVEGWSQAKRCPMTNPLLLRVYYSTLKLLSVMSVPLYHLKSETFSEDTSEYSIGELQLLRVLT